MPRVLFALVFFRDLPAADIYRQDEFADGRGLHPTDDIGQDREVLVKDRRGCEEVTKVLGKVVDVGK